jgi:hypothetical protein
MFVVKSREFSFLVGTRNHIADRQYWARCGVCSDEPKQPAELTRTGNPANPELIQIPAGQLYLVRPNSIKGSRECIFKDAVATIRRTGVEHQYQLVVTRAYEEGEEQLLDDDAESELSCTGSGWS